MIRRWQVNALVVVALLPFVAAAVAGPGMGQVEVAVWVTCLLMIAFVPAAVRRIRRDI